MKLITVSKIIILVIFLQNAYSFTTNENKDREWDANDQNNLLNIKSNNDSLGNLLNGDIIKTIGNNLNDTSIFDEFNETDLNTLQIVGDIVKLLSGHNFGAKVTNNTYGSNRNTGTKVSISTGSDTNDGILGLFGSSFDDLNLGLEHGLMTKNLSNTDIINQLKNILSKGKKGTINKGKGCPSACDGIDIGLLKVLTAILKSLQITLKGVGSCDGAHRTQLGLLNTQCQGLSGLLGSLLGILGLG